MVLGIKRSLFLCILLSLFLSCKSASVESNSKIETYLWSYLKDRYNSEFELISLEKANTPGAQFNNYEAKLISKTYDRRSFYVSISEKDELTVGKDQFPIILLEQAFLDNVDIKLYKDFPVVMEIEGEFVEDKYLDGINNIEQAAASLGNMQESSWLFYIYSVVDDPNKRVTEVEDMVINLLRQANKILPCAGSCTAYIYRDDELTEEDIQPDMNKGIVDRTPNEASMYEEWMMGWTQNNLASYANEFQSVVKNREVIPY